MRSYSKLQNGSDIRGTALSLSPGETVDLTEQAAWDLTLGFAKWLSKTCDKPYSELKVAVGHDSRLSGEALQNVVGDALFSVGISVLDCGMASTPAMFMSCIFPDINADGAVMITASHLPPSRNGFKYFTKNGGLDKSDIKDIVIRAEQSGSEVRDDISDFESVDLMGLYCAHLRGVIASGLGADPAEKPLSGMRIAVDAGNGAGGFYARDVLEPLGADCRGSRFLDPDGSFPNHVPNPENAAAMASICEAVKADGSDLGLIFDTDVDRAAAVDSKGCPIARNEAIALSAALVAEDYPGCTVVTDSITSNELHTFLEKELGLKHLRYQRGYKNVINQALALCWEGEDAELAMETSGHAALRENYFLDDGAYLAAKIVIKAAKLKREGEGIEACIAALASPAEAAEFRLGVGADDFSSYADRVLEELKNAVLQGELPGMSLELPNYEGVRINIDAAHGNGWLLIRKSLHEPLMPLNIESSAAGGVDTIKGIIYGWLAKYPGIKLI